MTRENGHFNCPVQSTEGAGLLLEFLDRRLSPDLSAQLERHVAVCADCSRVVEAQRSVWAALDNWEPEEASDDFDRRLFARLEQEDRRSNGLLAGVAAAMVRMFPAIPLSRAVPVAAMCALLMGGFLYKQPSVVDTSDKVVAEMVAVDVEQVENTLADLDMLQQLGVAQIDEAAAKQAI